MDRIAAFIDAGYLFAQGGKCLVKSEIRRESLRLNERAAVEFLTSLCRRRDPQVSLPRIYWYDGARQQPTLQQSTLAGMDNVKVRLGFINSAGQQKGVDSLIVTDLIDLARNRAISDALVLSGDEDVRIGVQIAQSFGVRVHLVEIQPAKGSQSLQLQQEADTCTELSAADLGPFLSIMTQEAAESPLVAASAEVNSLDELAARACAKLAKPDASNLLVLLEKSKSLPPEIDRPLLAQARSILGRDLTGDERRSLRGSFIHRLRSLYSQD